MEWMKKHTDTVIVLGGISASLFWMNSKFNEIKKDLMTIKTVLFLKGILPAELAVMEGEQ